MTSLDALVATELDAVPPAHAAAMGADLARRFANAGAVLFYGSVLRTGDVEGVMDFYVLTTAPRSGLRGLAGRVLWPDVSYHEFEADGRTYRAKVASMTVAQFSRAVTGRGVDTTIWTRFVQPSALVWSVNADVAGEVRRAVAQAAITAARFAAVVGPAQGPPQAYWTALFRQTYAAEFRVEAPGREAQIIANAPERFDAILPAAWEAGDVPYENDAGELRPRLDDAERTRVLRAWRLRRTLGKPLNLARLVKAAFTFEGAGRYAAWKIERHTGVAITVTPWRERHLILASPGVFWQLWKARRKA